jgi:hypothetical protein
MFAWVRRLLGTREERRPEEPARHAVVAPIITSSGAATGLAVQFQRMGVQVAVKPRAKSVSEREAQLSAIKDLAQNRPAPHAAASFWTGVVVLAGWLLLFGGILVLLAVVPYHRLAHALGRAAVIPMLLLWLASAHGFIKGSLGLVQPRGKRALAVGGCIMNGLLCFGPLVTILARL